MTWENCDAMCQKHIYVCILANVFLFKQSHDRRSSQWKSGTTTHTATLSWRPWRTFCKVLVGIPAFPFQQSSPSCSLLTKPCQLALFRSESKEKDWNVRPVLVWTIPCWYYKLSPLAMLMTESLSVTTQNAASLTLMTATPAPSPASVSQRLAGSAPATSVLRSISDSMK